MNNIFNKDFILYSIKGIKNFQYSCIFLWYQDTKITTLEA